MTGAVLIFLIMTGTVRSALLLAVAALRTLVLTGTVLGFLLLTAAALMSLVLLRTVRSALLLAGTVLFSCFLAGTVLFSCFLSLLLTACCALFRAGFRFVSRAARFRRTARSSLIAVKASCIRNPCIVRQLHAVRRRYHSSCGRQHGHNR